MFPLRFPRRPSSSLALVVLAVALIPLARGEAQDNGGNNQGGVQIDPQGLLKAVTGTSTNSPLVRKRNLAFVKNELSSDVASSTSLRKVSLVRLETALRESVKTGKPVPTELKYLAGLQRIDYIFIDPVGKDVVLAGPAEAFAPDGFGRMLGLKSGRPTLQLDDLRVAMQTVKTGEFIGCSIDPVPENLASLSRWIAANSQPALPGQALARYPMMAKILGQQNIRVWGVPEDSRFARVLVEADYRMKLVSMGLERSNVPGFHNHLSMLAPNGNSIQRWWFTPYFEAIRRTPDGDAFEIAGQRVQLCAQEEISDGRGQRQNATTTRVSTQKYAQHFTDKFPQLAEKSGIFADLQNLIDLSVVAAILHHERIPEKIGWRMSLLADLRELPVEKFAPAKKVQSVYNTRRAGRNVILGLIGGGVSIDAEQTMRTYRTATQPNSPLPGVRQVALKQPAAAATRWWWD